MFYKEYKGINAFLVEMSQALLRHGVSRETRGQKCIEFPHPVTFKLTYPTARIVTLPERKWNWTLPYAESLWLAAGRNDLAMVGRYLKKLYDFSDDGETMRAGYGPRFRSFIGVSDDYNIRGHRSDEHQSTQRTASVDQFGFVEASFRRDPFTRQGVISIGDPPKDCFGPDGVLKVTKDFPCARTLQLIRVGNTLDMIVHMRSNDFVWGASAVNIFNFTFLQEYFAQILGLSVGAYYHVANNFHYYEGCQEMVETLAALGAAEDEPYVYKRSISSLEDFDAKVANLARYEQSLREDSLTLPPAFDDDFFQDWAGIFYAFHAKGSATKAALPAFAHPLLADHLTTSVSRQVMDARAKQLKTALQPGKDAEKHSTT